MCSDKVDEFLVATDLNTQSLLEAKIMTTSNILQLLIPLREIEHLTELEVGEVFVARTYRTTALKRPIPLLNFCAKQLLAVGLVWMMGMIPVARWIEGNYGALDDHPQEFVAINSSIDFTVISVWNLYMWRRRKRIKTLLRLLDEVDQFNRIIQSVNVVRELSLARGEDPSPNSEVLRVLQLTRQSLLAGLQVDRLLRAYQDSHHIQRSLVQEIETNLADLQELRTHRELDDYGQLLHQACQIGTSVYQELQELGKF
jgi:hypothetical protein